MNERNERSFRGVDGHLMVSKWSGMTLISLSLSASLTVRGTHSRQLQTPYVRTGLVPNSLELFQVRWACTEARLPVLIRRVRISCGRIPLAMRACLERGIIREAEYRPIFELYRVRFPVKKESNGC